MAEAIPRSGDAPDPRPRDPPDASSTAGRSSPPSAAAWCCSPSAGVGVQRGRPLATDEPVLGDVELVQMGCALAVAAFLPWAQMKNAHVIVDFFTHTAPLAVRRVLDRIAAIILTVLAFIISPAQFCGAWEAYQTARPPCCRLAAVVVPHHALAPVSSCSARLPPPPPGKACCTAKGAGNDEREIGFTIGALHPGAARPAGPHRHGHAARRLHRLYRGGPAGTR